MGNTRWDPSDWTAYSASTSTKSRAEIFTSRTIDAALDPAKIDVRESVDSTANPNSTPIILASDVTGSMGALAEQIVKHELGKIMGEIYDRKPVTDPHILGGAIGDTYWDRHPFQATQFEADLAVAKQMEKLYIEGGGGGNAGESYLTAWYFAAFKTKCDAFAKGRKGFLFTIGDEAPLDDLPKEHVKEFFGDDVQEGFTTKGLLELIAPNWNVFHLIIKPVSSQPVKAKWTDLLGQNAISVSDVGKMGEIIVSTMELLAGKSIDEIADSWSGDTSMVVRDALGSLVPGADTAGAVRL